ncbi:MAG: hypothetical protein SWK90_04220 [Chloroflexota bacterium]|nr:hypothetical protein [Chloroflexota bacterium]
MVDTARYRVKQFLWTLTARISEEEVEQAIRILTPEAQALFLRQAVQDQRHALVVYHALRQANHTNPQLLAAALLHDVGKAAARLPAWQRAALVLLEHLSPRLLARLSQGEARGWRRPFVIHTRHPELGSRWAQDAGCSVLTVALIRRHQDRLTDCQTEEDQLLAALQAADNLN